MDTGVVRMGWKGWCCVQGVALGAPFNPPRKVNTREIVHVMQTKESL